jgi:hypothetical protein
MASSEAAPMASLPRVSDSLAEAGFGSFARDWASGRERFWSILAFLSSAEDIAGEVHWGSQDSSRCKFNVVGTSNNDDFFVGLIAGAARR